MENQEFQEQQNNEEKTFFQSTTAKMIMVGALTLFLLIPLSLVQDLISERSQRKNEVVADTVRKLKTEESRKISSYTRDEDEDDADLFPSICSIFFP